MIATIQTLKRAAKRMLVPPEAKSVWNYFICCQQCGNRYTLDGFPIAKLFHQCHVCGSLNSVSVARDAEGNPIKKVLAA